MTEGSIKFEGNELIGLETRKITHNTAYRVLSKCLRIAHDSFKFNDCAVSANNKGAEALQ